MFCRVSTYLYLRQLLPISSSVPRFSYFSDSSILFFVYLFKLLPLWTTDHYYQQADGNPTHCDNHSGYENAQILNTTTNFDGNIFYSSQYYVATAVSVHSLTLTSSLLEPPA